jgi:hypothetical protein
MKGLIAAFLLFGTIRPDADGYLATVGPVHVRFAPRNSTKAGLPPLKMDNSVPQPEKKDRPPAVEIQPDSLLLRPETMRLEGSTLDLSPTFDLNVGTAPDRKTDADAPPAQGFTGLFQESSRTNSTVTSSALLQIFNSSSRPGNRSSIIMPLEFVPGIPPQDPPPSSRAAYSTSERP